MSSPVTSALVFNTTLAANDGSMVAQAAEAIKYKSFIVAAAADYGIPVCAVCGIGSRESNWGLILKPRGPAGSGDFGPRASTNAYRSGPLPPDGHGFGRGLMQIDFDSHEFARSGKWHDPEANIRRGCELLAQFLQSMSKRAGPNVTPLEAAIAAYNAGPGRVLAALKSNQHPDLKTTNKNYSCDVLNRAGWFQAAGW